MDRLRRALVGVVAGLLVLALSAVVANAIWTPGPTSGPGAASAATVGVGSTPTASVSAGRAVTVAWAAVTLSDGQPVDGYLVRRYDAASGVLAAVGLGCTGTIAATSCVEAAVPPGSWRYTVTPLIGVNWRGAESPRSGIVTIGAATLTLTTTQFGGPAAFPQTTTGTLTGFAANEGVTYRLDAATPLTGSPAAVGPSGSAAITSLSIPAVADGPHTVWAIGNAGVPSQASAAIFVDRTAPVVSASAAPAPNAAGWNAAAPVTVTLSANDGAGVGGVQIRYTTDGSDPTTSGTALTYSGPLSLNVTTTVRFAASDALGNTSPVGSQTVRIDTTAPSSALSLTNVTGGAFRAGATVWYRGAAAGSFTIVNAVSDAGSGPAASATAALTGVATGWSHTPSTVSTPSGGPFTSAPFSWTAGTTSSPSQTVTSTDVAGNAAATSLTFVNDPVGPVGGSVDATGLGGTGGRYSTSTTLNIALAKGTDSQSGLAPTGARLLRATATLSSAGTADGACGAFGAYVQVGANDPASPVSNTVADRACYRYQYVVADNVGNTTTYASPDIKVDTTAPSTPALTLSGQTGDTAISGSTVYINPQTGHSGGFQVQAVTTDLDSGIQQVAFPALAGVTGGGADLTSPYATTYAWGPGATAAGSQSVTATNNAGVTGPAASFTVVADTTAPAGGALTVNGAAASALGTTTGVSSTTFAINSRSDFAEATGPTASGLLSSTLVRDRAPLAGGLCGAVWSGAVTLAGAPAQNAAGGIVSGFCYRYTLAGTDRVGNVAAISTIVKVDTSAPTFGAPSLVLAATGPYAVVSGTTAYYNGTVGAGSSIAVSAPNVADPESGVAGVAFPSPAGFAGGGTDVTSPYGVTYSWSASAAAGSQSVVATNGTGLTASAAFSLVRDVTAPAGGALTVNGTAASAAGTVSASSSTSFTIGLRTDFAEAQSAASAGLATSVLARDQAPFDGVTCGATWTNPATIVGAPVQNAAAGITTGTCFRYTLTGTDRVGNAATLTTIVRVSRLTATDVLLTGKGKGGAASNNDTVTITYSDVVDASTFCASWTNGTAQQLTANGQVVVTIANVGVSDTISVATTSGCSFHLGIIDTNADYVSATSTYGGTGGKASELRWDPATRTLTVVLGGLISGSGNKKVPDSIPVYTPDPVIADLLGNTIAPGPFAGTLSGF